MSLAGLHVIEFAGLAPAPFAGLILADNGASVTRIDKPGSVSVDVLCRGKRSIAINPKIPSGRDTLRKLLSGADVVLEPFRPGVMERLGLGPEVFFGSGEHKGFNEKLVYARMVGFPRTGPHKDMAGHDINFLALSGVLSMLPGHRKPNVPLNLLADFAGGGLMCVLGILLALIERGKTGRGRVVDVDMVSGTRYLATFPLLHAMFPLSPLFADERGKNMLDGGAPFYDVYVCKGGGFMSVGCLEPQFFKEFIRLFVDALPREFSIKTGWLPMSSAHRDRDEWPNLKEFLEKGFMTNTRDYWANVFHGSDACALPVLTHMEARASALPDAPFFSALRPMTTPFNTGDPCLQPGKHTQEILEELGLRIGDRRQLALDGALGEEARLHLLPTKL